MLCVGPSIGLVSLCAEHVSTFVGSRQAPASTHARYCATVVGCFAIRNRSTRIAERGVSDAKPSVASWTAIDTVAGMSSASGALTWLLGEF
jgi:hypothetical protein